jgi:polysaccharide biosynthesis protein PslH
LPIDSLSPALLFVGNLSYPPSADAALYFCKEILPQVCSLLEGVETWIVGANPIPELLQLDGKFIHVTGQVPDVTPYYRRSSVCVVPVRAGGGTRLKILEAMALGRPVVSTTVGSEGLAVVDGEHLLVADSPKVFAEQIVHLLTDQTLYERITANARRLVVTQYDWDAIAARLLQIYDELAPDNISAGSVK